MKSISINRLFSSGYVNDCQCNVLIPQSVFKRALPVTLYENISHSARQKIQKEYTSQMICYQPTVYYSRGLNLAYQNSSSAIPLVRHNNTKYYIDDFAAYPSDNPSLFLNRLKSILCSFYQPAVSFYDDILFLNGECRSGFFHWVHELLPQLLLFQSKFDNINSYKYLLPRISRKYQTETLSLLGIQGHQILSTVDINIQRQSLSYVQTTHLLSPITYSGNPTPASVAYLYDWLTPFIEQQKSALISRKFVILRDPRNSNGQRVTFDTNAIDLLRASNYELIYLETLSFLEQCSLFYHAESIIAPHGAGLSLAFLCSTKTVIVEIQNTSYVNPCYWALCSIRKQKIIQYIKPSNRNGTIVVTSYDIKKALTLLTKIF
jgi:hypothetical protein